MDSSAYARRLAREAAGLRHGVVEHLSNAVAREQWAANVEAGASFVTPSTWRTLPAGEQVSRLIDAELARLGGEVWACDADVAAAITAAACQPVSWPLTADVVPSQSGMITIASGATDWVAASWGPPPSDLGEGVYVSVWTHDASPARPKPIVGPAVINGTTLLRFRPLLDTRLTGDADVTNVDTLVWRTVVACWTAITTDILTTHDIRVGDDNVCVLTCRDSTTAQRITSAATQASPTSHQPGPPIDPGSDAAPGAVDPVFAAGRDKELPQHQRWLPRTYRDLSQRAHALIASIDDRYPSIWGVIDDATLRPRWPSWCFIPMLDVATILARQYQVRDADTCIAHATVIAGLAAWRASGRHAVVPSPQLAAQTRASDLTGADFPTDLPHTLQVPAVYLAGYTAADNIAVLQHSTGGPELQFISMLHSQPATIDAAGRFCHQILITPGTILNALTQTSNRSQLPPTENRTTAAYYAPLTVFTNLLTQPDTTITDAATALGRRPPASWPDARRTPHDEATLWLLQTPHEPTYDASPQ